MADTVPVAVHCGLPTSNDFCNAGNAAIECVGDAGTTAALFGGIVGTKVGNAGIPAEGRVGI